MWDLIVSVPDHCLSFYIILLWKFLKNFPKVMELWDRIIYIDLTEK